MNYVILFGVGVLALVIHQAGTKIMSAVTDFAAKVQSSFDKLGTDLDGIKTEIADLNTTIQNLQNSQGQLGPSDQAALDDIAAKSAALASKADALVVPTLPPPPA